MSFLEKIRTMDKRLRVTLIATGLLVVPGIGQFVALSDLSHTGREGDLAIFFMFAAIFIVPTAVILTIAVLAGIRKTIREHEKLALLGALNLLIALNITWFFIHACSWAAAAGILLQTCR